VGFSDEARCSREGAACCALHPGMPAFGDSVITHVMRQSARIAMQPWRASEKVDAEIPEHTWNELVYTVVVRPSPQRSRPTYGKERRINESER
jgi:hypothetical protein